MKKPTLCFVLFALTLQACATGAKFTPNAPMNVDASFWEGRRFIQNNQVVNRADVIHALESHPQAKSHISSMQGYEVAAVVSSAGGGFMLGYGLVSLSHADGGQPVLIGTGIAAIVLSAFLDQSASTHARSAVEAYNAGLTSSPTKAAPPGKTRSEFKLTPAGFAWVF